MNNLNLLDGGFHKIKLQPSKHPLLNCAYAILIGLILSADPGLAGAEILWSSGHETGNLSDWYENGGGGVFNTGGPDAQVTVTDEAAYAGKYAVKMEVWGIDHDLRACRIFRWGELLTEGYFSCWFMFPVLPAVNNWFNIFQFKKENPETSDPTWYNEVKNKMGQTVLTLTHWNQQWDIPFNVNKPPALTANQWFHVEWYYKDGINDGQISIWINGTRVWALQNVNTRGVDPYILWAPALYGENVSPGNLVLYMDDAVISTERVGANIFRSESSSSGGGGGGCFISTIAQWVK